MSNQAMLTGDQARRTFQELGLSYSQIRRYDVELLHAMCVIEIDHVRRNPESAISKGLRMARRVDFNCKDGRLTSAFMYVNCTYFKKREAISFNGDGFIGFAGWASSANEQPFLRAFIKWCHLLAGDAE